MNKKILITLIFVFGLVIIGMTTLLVLNYNKLDRVQERTGQSYDDITKPIDKDNCLAEDCLAVENLEYPVGDLPESVVVALGEAIQDEYKAHTTYEKVIEKFGSSRPFSMIIRAEEQHIASLKALYDKYGKEIPANEWGDKLEAPATLTASCQMGVDAEIANAALYRDELLPEVVDYPDIERVFTNLMNASNDKHLPAFEKCN